MKNCQSLEIHLVLLMIFVFQSANFKSFFQEEDVSGTLALLQTCAPYYLDGSLTDHCSGSASRCSQVPPLCSLHNAVFTIFHFLTDTNFAVLKVSITAATSSPELFLVIYLGAEFRTLSLSFVQCQMCQIILNLLLCWLKLQETE